VNYDLPSKPGGGDSTRTGASLDLISTTATSQYLPCPTDGIVHVLSSSSPGNKFTLDSANASLTFNTSNSSSYMNRFSMYDLAVASPLTKLSFQVSFNDNTSKEEWWYLTMGQKQAGSDSVFTGTSFISGSPAY